MIIHKLKLGEGAFGKAFLVKFVKTKHRFETVKCGTEDKLSEEEFRISKPESWEKEDRFDGKETASCDTFTAVVKLAKNAERAEETINTEYYAYRRLASWKDGTCINPYYDFIVVSPRNRSLLVLPYAGSSIGSYFAAAKRTEKRFSMEDIAQISKDLSRCLNAIHACHLLHRDVSVNNIMILEKEKCKRAILLDFGLAIDSGVAKKVSSKQVGTLSFRSIDTMKGTGPYSEKDDYESALWVLLCMFLNGVLPWRTTDPFEEILDKKIKVLQLFENWFLGADDSMKCDYSSDSLDSSESVVSEGSCVVCGEYTIKCMCEEFVKIPGVVGILEKVVQKKTRIKEVCEKSLCVCDDSVRYCNAEMMWELEEELDDLTL